VGRRAILTDRDGTICDDVGYLSRVEQLRLLPHSGEALARAGAAGFQVVLVTNQSAIARGWLTEDELTEIHERLRAELARGGARLDGIYHCPHHPQAHVGRYRRVCDCRKPRPGMLRQAREEMGLDLGSSYMIGDRLDDLAAGAAVGATPVLVRTGNGTSELGRLARGAGPRPAFVANHILDAVCWILERQLPAPGSVERGIERGARGGC